MLRLGCKNKMMLYFRCSWHVYIMSSPKSCVIIQKDLQSAKFARYTTILSPRMPRRKRKHPAPDESQKASVTGARMQADLECDRPPLTLVHAIYNVLGSFLEISSQSAGSAQRAQPDSREYYLGVLTFSCLFVCVQSFNCPPSPLCLRNRKSSSTSCWRRGGRYLLPPTRVPRQWTCHHPQAALRKHHQSRLLWTLLRRRLRQLHLPECPSLPSRHPLRPMPASPQQNQGI